MSESASVRACACAALAADVRELELAVLHTLPVPARLDEGAAVLRDVRTLAELLVRGAYVDVLRHASVERLLKGAGRKDAALAEDSEASVAFARVSAHVTALASAASASACEVALVAVMAGVAALRVFVQQAWTGPALASDVLAACAPELARVPREDAVAALACEGEQCYALLPAPHALLLARALLVTPLHALHVHAPSVAWWAARALFVHQRCLTGPSAALHDAIAHALSLAHTAFAAPTAASCTAHADAADDADDAELAPNRAPESAPLAVPDTSTPEARMRARCGAELALERALAAHYYHNVADAQQYVRDAQRLTGLRAELSGALGRRTRFQDFDLPQLVLLAESHPDHAAQAARERAQLGTEEVLPHVIANPDPDAVALAEVAFSDAVPEAAASALAELDACIVLAQCYALQPRTPHDALAHEELRARLARVLHRPLNALVTATALLLQARLELHSSRTMDKAALQLEQLLQPPHDAAESLATAAALRQRFFHWLLYPPRHELQRELGRAWLRVGAAASALALFTPLEMWEECVACLILQRRPAAAEELVRERLAALTPADASRAPALLCLLGDITRDEAHYHEAWARSNGCCAQAMRALGARALQEARYSEAVAHLQRALAVNPQYSTAWYQLGVAALALQNWTLARQAFLRVVHLRPEDAEAWNNLASAHVRLERWRPAQRALREALRLRRDSWQMWENLATVALRLGAWHDVLAALEAILELRDGHVDTQLLALLIDHVLRQQTTPGSSAEEAASAPESRLQAVLEAFIRKLQARVRGTAQPDVWDVLARYEAGCGRLNAALECRVKHCRALMRADWAASWSATQPLLAACHAYACAALEVGSEAAYSARLLVQSVVKQAALRFDDAAEVRSLRTLLIRLAELAES